MFSTRYRITRTRILSGFLSELIYPPSKRLHMRFSTEAELEHYVLTSEDEWTKKYLAQNERASVLIFEYEIKALVPEYDYITRTFVWKEETRTVISSKVDPEAVIEEHYGMLSELGEQVEIIEVNVVDKWVVNPFYNRFEKP